MSGNDQKNINGDIEIGNQVASWLVKSLSKFQILKFHLQVFEIHLPKALSQVPYS